MLHLIAIVIIIATQFGDYLSTLDAMRHGGVEVNPFVRAIGLIPTKVGGTVIFSIISLLNTGRDALIISLIIASIYSVIIAWNLHVGAK
jgi:hypothetical protein